MNESKSHNAQSAMDVIDAGRRSALRKIAVGVGVLAGISVLPKRWTSPIIGQVVLPAHAQTSGITGSFANTIPGAIGQVGQGKTLLDSLVQSGKDFFVADANAALNRPEYICVTLAGSTATAVLQFPNTILYQGTGTVTGGVSVNTPYQYDIIFLTVAAASISVKITEPYSYEKTVTLSLSSPCPSGQ